MEYIYYWYHHIMPESERKEIFETIRDKDYEKLPMKNVSVVNE